MTGPADTKPPADPAWIKRKVREVLAGDRILNATAEQTAGDFERAVAGDERGTP